MIRVLWVSRDDAFLSNAAGAMDAFDIDAKGAKSGREALSVLSKESYDMVIADETLGDMTGLGFAEKLVRVSPMTNCAVVSSLSPEAFHEAGEGLGILMQLPPRPGNPDVEKLLKHLKGILDSVR